MPRVQRSPIDRFPHIDKGEQFNQDTPEKVLLNHIRKTFENKFNKIVVKDEDKKVRFQIVKGDLFNTNSEAIAHCVSEDLKMGKGIAVEFVKRFARINELKDQNPKEGMVVYLERDEKVMRVIFYMITKQKYFHIPDYEKLMESLLYMRKKCEELKVKSLGMPLIACGLDRLEWTVVEKMIQVAFWDLDIDITIYIK